MQGPLRNPRRPHFSHEQEMWVSRVFFRKGSILNFKNKCFVGKSWFLCWPSFLWARYSPWVCSQSINNIMDLMLLLSLVAVAAAAAVASATSAAHREDGGVDPSANALGNRYAITSIFPESGPTKGGTDVILAGNGIIDGDNLACAFGAETDDNMHAVVGAISVARRMSRTEILCVAPEWGVPGDNVSLSLELNGMVVATSPSPFHYYETPIITSIYPTSGAALGGTRITLRGSGFLSRPGMTCRLGLVDVPAVWKGNDEVTCTSPPGTVASTPLLLSFSLNGVDHSAPVMYRYTESPLVRKISPAKGSISGGTALALTGQGFEDSLELKCVFRLKNNHTEATTMAKFISPNELTCMSPVVEKLTRATVHVTVNGVDVAVEGARFEYIEDAVINSIKPASGPVDGGTWVNLMGTGMVNGNSSRCRFGKSDPGSVYWISQTEIQCISPPARGIGIVNVTLADYPLIAVEYSYYEHPVISSIQPPFGVSSGGTLVTLNGSGFLSSQDIVCRFGSIDVSAYFITEEQISFLSPSGNAGSSHSVSLSLNGIDFSPSSIDYLYIDPVEVRAIHPRWMDEAGGALIKVIGSGFLDSDALACIFRKPGDRGDPPFYIRATYLSKTILQCSAPPVSAPCEMSLRVTANGVDVSSSGAQFEYVCSVVSTIYPKHGPVTGGTNVRLTGSGFHLEGTNCCRFGNAIVPAQWVSQTLVQCESPLSSAGDVVVSYSNDGLNFVNSTSHFSYITPAIVHSIHPRSGPKKGGTEIRISGDGFSDEDDWKCLFNGSSVSAVFSSLREIRCLTPASFDRISPLHLLEPDGSVMETGFTFQYYDELQLISFFPESSPCSGGTTIKLNIRGMQLDSSYTCIFGEDIDSLAKPVNSSFIECMSPRWDTPGETTLSVVSTDSSADEIVTETKPFTFYQWPVFSEASPSSIYHGMSADIYVQGGPFLNSPSSKCRLGQHEIHAHCESVHTSAIEPLTSKLPLSISTNGADFHDCSILLDVSPKECSPSHVGGTHSPTSVALSVSANGQEFSHYPIQFFYHPNGMSKVSAGIELPHTARISHISPAIGLPRFGELGHSRAAFVTSTELSCLSPNISPVVTHLIDVGIQVSLNGIDFAPAVAHFRFTPPALVHSMFPNQGSVSGGTEVTVKGANMFTSITSNAAVCIFGNESVPASLLSTEELTCVAPAHTMDEGVYFAVSLNGVDLLQHTDARFFYLPHVKRVSIEPSGGPLTGGTLVTVTGTDFDKSFPIGCKFGSYSDGIVYVSDKTIQCRSPPHPPGTVDFVVITNDNEISLDDVVFEYYKAPTILFADPISGPQHGGTVVRIYGSDFRSNVNYLCHFGDVQVSGQFVATDAIECSSPRIISDVDENHVDLVVSETKSNFTANTLRFAYVPAPSLMRLSPPYVFFNDSDIISVFGSHLNTTDVAWCRFTLPSKAGGSEYYETVRASSIYGDGHVVCKVPAHPFPPATLQVEAFVEVSTNGWDYSASRLSVKYVPKPTIHTVRPPMGSVNGGTVLAVLGTNFLQESNHWCSFGSAGSVPSEWISHEEIWCTTPAAQYPVNSTLSLNFADNSGVVDGAQYFAYHRELSLEEAHPTRGFVTGGTVVTIRGTGFLNVPTLSCQFGNKTVLAKYISLNSIECSSPRVYHTQDVEQRVSLNGVEFSAISEMSQKTFTYDGEVELIHTLPSRVPVTDHHGHISVIGRSFINTTSLSCLFGQYHATFAQYVSGFEVRCNLPQMIEVGETDVRISLNGVDFSSEKASITFVGPALIASVSPHRIQEGQEVEILVKGSNFINSSDLQCHFGRHGHIWSPARWIDANTLKCVTPILNLTHSGVEYVCISNNGGSDTARQLFGLEVTARTQFISMSPDLGYTHGGTEVTITLGNLKFMSNFMCLFGTKAVPASLISADSIVCKSPSNSFGDVTLKLMSGEMMLATSTFEYIHPPTVESLQPAMGALEGGTSVWVYGAGFIGVTHCRFVFDDNTKMVPAKVESDASLSCDAPGSDNDADASVQVTHNGQDFLLTGFLFRFRARPRLFSLAPSFGSDLGEKVVHVLGENFIDTPTMCRFGTILIDATYISPTLLSCVAPALKIGSAPVSITLNGVDFISSETLVYESITLPQIQSIEPTAGLIYGETTVVLHTTALRDNNRNITCHFGKQSVKASYRSTNLASCLAPAVQAHCVVDVSLSVDGERFSADEKNAVLYTYVSEPEVAAISPNIGWTTGGAVVSVSIKEFEPFSLSEVSCSFGYSVRFIDALQVRDDTVLCSVPSMSEKTMRRSAPILLRISDGQNVFQIKSSSEFTYYEPAIVTKVEPPFGSIRGGSTVRVSGINFSNLHGLQCLFGAGIAVDAEFLDEREVRCVVPEWSRDPKIVDIHIGIKDGATLSLVSHAIFEYLPHPSIESIHPRFGSIDGGTFVTLHGNALAWPHASNYLSCRFGNSTLVPVHESPAGDLVCELPPLQVARCCSEI